jgi:hypothetical protein
VGRVRHNGRRDDVANDVRCGLSHHSRSHFSSQRFEKRMTTFCNGRYGQETRDNDRRDIKQIKDNATKRKRRIEHGGSWHGEQSRR